VITIIVTVALLFNFNISTSPIAEKDETQLYQTTIKQANDYINNIKENDSTVLNFWVLANLKSANNNVSTFISKQCINVSKQTNIYNKNLLLILSQDLTKRQLFLKAYKKTKNINYLLAYYSVNGKGNKKINIFNKDKISSESQAYLDLLKYGKINANLLKLHRFSFRDIFITKILTIDKNKIVSLINYWYNNSKYQNDLLDTYKKITLIHIFHIIDKYNKVYQLNKKLDISKIPNTIEKLNTFKRITYANFILGYYYKNLKYYRNILIPLSFFLRSTKNILYIHLSYGNTLIRLGKIKKAQEQYEFVYNYPNATKFFKNYTSVINNLAVSYQRSGNFSKYINLQLSALKIASKNNNYKKQLIILNNLSIYYKDINDYKSALLYSKQALNIAKTHNLKSELASVYIGMGYIYKDYQHNYSKSLEEYNKALKIAKSTNDYQRKVVSESEIARLFEQEHKFKKAIKLRLKIAETTKAKNDKRSYVDILTGVIDDYATLNDFKESEIYLHKIEQIPNSILDFITLVKKNYAISELFVHHHKINSAISLLHKSISNILNRAKNSAEKQSGYVLLNNYDLKTFKLLASLLIKKSDYDSALRILDKIKTVNKARYSNSNLLKSNIFTEKELIRDKKLGDYIETLRSKIQKASKSQRINLQNKLEELITEKKQLESKILKNNDNSSINVTAIKSHLKAHEAILYFTKFNNQYYLATITRHSTKFDTLTFKKAQIDTIKHVIKELHKGNTNLKRLGWIYEKLFSKINLKRYNKLDVVPDGFLYELPIGILPIAHVDSRYSYGAAHYLIEDHPISYYTSLKSFNHTFHERNPHYKTDFLGIGISKFGGLSSTLSGDRTLAPLPYTQVEVSKIDSLLPFPANEKKMFLGKQGTEKAFRKWVSSTRIIHLATHSEVYYEDPLFSVIYLNQDPHLKKKTFKDDGEVHAYELFEMNLDSKMIMLSSCESGAGDYITGSGMIGLSRALTYAGAQSLVLNLWSINDQNAANISIKFYKYLKQGYSKAQALRKAKLFYLDTGNSNPYRWGSFVVTGDASPLFPKNPYERYYIIAGIILATLLLGFSYYNYQKK